MRSVLEWAAGLTLGVLVALTLLVGFGLDRLRGPIERAVTEATGRELVIDRPLKAVWRGSRPCIRLENLRLANAPWAKESHLFEAGAVEASIRLLPLLQSRLVLPQVRVESARLNLEVDAQGRKNWVLKNEAGGAAAPLVVHGLTLDEGALEYDDARRGTRISAHLAGDADATRFEAVGRYRGLDLSASGEGGRVAALGDGSAPFPLRARARIGATTVKLEGTVTGLARLERIDWAMQVSGRTMHDLYRILGVAFPSTKPYSASGRLLREGEVVRFENFSAQVGESDLAGTLQVDASGKRPFMSGELRSRRLHLADLGALVGTDRPRRSGVLPDVPFAPLRWASVDADVGFTADAVTAPPKLPIDNIAARIRLRDRILKLDPAQFGIADGRLAGRIELDGTEDTIRAGLDMRMHGVQLAKLVRSSEQGAKLAGELEGLVQLAGPGNSVDAMLGNANGKAGLYMDGGRVSRHLVELAALDLWDLAAVKLKGDEPVRVNCAIADFTAKRGVLHTNALLIDTEVVLIEGGGRINLATEEIRLKLNPKPKDASIASLNSPLYIHGTLQEPRLSPDQRTIAARLFGAVALGLVNPLLAVLPLLQNREVEESPCAQRLARAPN
jgi:uncharacterized protein involved in outer membrane biogenesis